MQLHPGRIGVTVDGARVCDASFPAGDADEPTRWTFEALGDREGRVNLRGIRAWGWPEEHEPDD